MGLRLPSWLPLVRSPLRWRVSTPPLAHLTPCSLLISRNFPTSLPKTTLVSRTNYPLTLRYTHHSSQRHASLVTGHSAHPQKSRLLALNLNLTVRTYFCRTCAVSYTMNSS